jgi:hypothetical protein
MKSKFYQSDFSFLEKQVEKVNSYLTKAHRHILLTVVIFEARNYANKNLPNNDDASMEPYLHSVKGSYHELKKEVSGQLQGSVQKNLGAVNVTTANQKIEKKTTEIRKEEEKEEHFLVDRSRIHLNHDPLGYKRNRRLTAVFAFGEIIWTISAFLKIGDILLLAIAAGIIIGIAQVSAVKTHTLIIKEIEDGLRKWKYIMYAAVGAIAFSILLGLLRYWFAHTVDGVNIPFIIINPFTFAGINLLFMIATGLIVYFYYPNREEIKKINELKKIDSELEKVRKEIQALKGQLNDLLKEREFVAELRIRIQGAEKELLERIDALYDTAVGMFKHENAIKRTDNLFPVAFKRPHDPLGKSVLENLLFT